MQPDLPNVARGDQQRIRQVLLNLLYNAVKFTVAGSVTVSVTMKSGELKPPDDMHCLDVCVKDTGIGISEEAQKKLLEINVLATTRPHKMRVVGTGSHLLHRKS